MRNNILAALPVLALGFSATHAQEASTRSPFEASLTSTIATADMKKITSGSNPAGYTLALGYRGELHPGLSTRVFLGFMSLSGIEGSGLENKKRPQLHAGWDIIKDYGHLSVFGGLTTTQWKQSINSTDPNFTAANRAEGIKLGARIGAEYIIGNGFSGTITFDQTEFNRRFNPSWVSVGVVYRFTGK